MFMKMVIKRLLKNIDFLYLNILLINLILINALPPYEVIINKKVLRFINLQDQCAFIEHEILFENVSKQNVSVYKFEIEPNVQHYRFSGNNLLYWIQRQHYDKSLRSL